MKLTRERMVLMGLLSLGGLALVVDRAVLGGGATNPQQAAAEAAADEHAAAATGGHDGDAAVLEALSDVRDGHDGPLLHRRLADTADAHAVSPLRPRDAFAPDESWIATEPEPDAETPVEADQAADERNEAQLAMERFRSEHRLQAVMADRGAGVAVVNDRPLRVGDRLGGWTLVRVGHRGASFALDGRRIELEVPD